MSDDVAHANVDQKPYCSHRCILPDEHDGLHQYGYNIPSDAERIVKLEAEIERLRSIVDMEFNSVNHLLGDSQPTKHVAELLAEWKEYPDV